MILFFDLMCSARITVKDIKESYSVREYIITDTGFSHVGEAIK